MKRIFITLLFIIYIFAGSNIKTQAINLKFWDNTESYAKILKLEEKDIRKLLHNQLDFVNKQNIEQLSQIYANSFVNNDGFNKEVYFKLIEDTWKIYPDITYEAKIQSVQIEGKYATAIVDEKAIAVAQDEINDVQVVGELYSTSKCIYYFEKTPKGWEITSENILEEFSALKYGDARYLDIRLNTPKQTSAGSYYTTTLIVNAPEDVMSIVAISKDTISYPQKNDEKAYRLLPEDNVLERIFIANSDNINEYNVASIATSKAYDVNGETKVVMSGAAIIMSRVNVIPQNKFVNLEAEDAKL